MEATKTRKQTGRNVVPGFVFVYICFPLEHENPNWPGPPFVGILYKTIRGVPLTAKVATMWEPPQNAKSSQRKRNQWAAFVASFLETSDLSIPLAYSVRYPFTGC